MTRRVIHQKLHVYTCSECGYRVECSCTRALHVRISMHRRVCHDKPKRVIPPGDPTNTHVMLALPEKNYRRFNTKTETIHPVECHM